MAESREADAAPVPADGSRLEVSVGRLPDEDGLLVVDPIERHRFRLFTPAPVSPRPADAGDLRYPVDAAVTVETRAIELPTIVATYVRDADGEMLAEAEHFAYEEFPDGSYTVELCAPMKLYLQASSELTVSADTTRTRLEFGDPCEVLVGARSHHERPAATITTTEDPRDLMQAVSAFGSALKTLSPERSYPTLRGHPPLVELGDELDIPAGLEPPKTGVRIELPPTRRSVYVAAPLAYYLGARIVPGDRPRIVTDDGFEHRLDEGVDFEREVERVLKQTFFLDCVTRTEGIYQVPLHERAAIEGTVDLEFDALYDRSIADQLAAYLSVPFETVEPHLPEWKLTTTVSPSPDTVELLPFMTNDLAVVQTPSSDPVTGSAVQSAATDQFLRDEFTRSAAAESGTSSQRQYVRPTASDSLEQAYVGEGTPLGASKATAEAYRNRLARSPVEGEIGITVVCNDPRMAVERDIVNEVYGSREDLPFDVTVHYDLTVGELREVLTAETEFLHYIGHIDAGGFECSDGRLDATALSSVGPDSFLLNACQSYEQGQALVGSGAVGGIVTLSDVINSGAVRMGRALARLLDRGFPLRSALEVARDESVIGDQYIVVGDGGLAIAQAESGTPNVCDLERAPPSADYDFEATYRGYPVSERGMGSMVMPAVEGNEEYYLNSGDAATFELSRGEVARYLSLEEIPVRIDGELAWSSELDVESL
jgi:hypothetical protein